MEILFFIFASLAAFIHIYIFILETFLWTKPITRNIFGITKQYAEATKEMAANQGVYNGALAGIVFAGIVASIFRNNAVGYSLIFAGTTAMAIAAAYLFMSSPNKRPAAIKQALFPLGTLCIGIILTIL